MFGNFLGNSSSFDFGTTMEPLNLTIAAAQQVSGTTTASKQEISGDTGVTSNTTAEQVISAAALSAFWNQFILNMANTNQTPPHHHHGNRGTVAPAPAPSTNFVPGSANILHQLQQQQQQQQQLIAFLTLKNHIEQIKNQMVLIREQQNHQQNQGVQFPAPGLVQQFLEPGLVNSSPSDGFQEEDEDSSGGAKLEPATPSLTEEAPPSVPVGLVKVAPQSGSKASRKRSRKLSSGGDNNALTPTFSADEPSPPNSKNVCIGGYYDANNVYAKLVTVSDEARRKLAAMPNIIGDYICALCGVKFDDAFCLAAHNCPKLEKTEHRCPECNKVFSCPANLASHRRWHRPKVEQTSGTSPSGASDQGAEKKPSISKSASLKRPAPMPTSSKSASSASSKSKHSRPQVTPGKVVEEQKLIEHRVAVPPEGGITIACPVCSVQCARNELRSHLTSHIAAQLATTFQQQKTAATNSQQQSSEQTPSGTSSFVNNLMAAAAAVN